MHSGSRVVLGAFLLSTILAGRSVEAAGGKGESPPRLADVVSVAVDGKPGAFQLRVEVLSLDVSCKLYADWWEVLDADGKLLYRRVLRHSHVTEQPFIRGGGPVDVEPEQTIWIRAHMHPTGYGGVAVKGSVRDGFAAATPRPGFGAGLEDKPPLPDGCAF